jgi:ATP-dependent DNA ligase
MGLEGIVSKRKDSRYRSGLAASAIFVATHAIALYPTPPARVKLYSRPGNDLTYRFPLIVEALT